MSEPIDAATMTGAFIRKNFAEVLTTGREMMSKEDAQRVGHTLEAIERLPDLHLGSLTMAIGNMVDNFGITGFLALIALAVRHDHGATKEVPPRTEKKGPPMVICPDTRCMTVGEHLPGCPSFKQATP